MHTTQPISWRQRAARTGQFLKHDIWDADLSSLSGRRRFGISAARVLQLVWRGFREDECPLHASALTFSTMMAIVPVLALSLALARGLGGDVAAKAWIRNRVTDWTSQFQKHERQDDARIAPSTPPFVVEPITALAPPDAEPAAGDDAVDPAALAAQINRFVEAGFERMDNVSFGALGGVGLALLVWMVIEVLGSVETSFNRVWGVTVERTLWRKFTDYLSILFVLPLLLLAATSLPIMDFATRYLNPNSARVVQEILGSGWLKHLIVFGMTTLAFTFLIMFIPNTRVRPLPGLSGGVIAALLFLAWLWLCAAMQVGAARMGKIYGSFAALPIVLAWVHVNWQIVFLGAEVAFAMQNCTTYRMEQGAARASIHTRLLLALAVVTEVARTMLRGGGPFDAQAYAAAQRIPVRLLLGTMDDLVRAGFLAEVGEAPVHYVLLRAPETLLVRDVMDGLLQAGVEPDALGLGRIPPDVAKVLHQAGAGADAALKKMTFSDLARKA